MEPLHEGRLGRLTFKKVMYSSDEDEDTAFKLINDGRLQHNNGPKATRDQQSPDKPVDEAASMERDKEISLSDDPKPLDNEDYEIVPNPSVPPGNLEEAAMIV
nr:protein VASCULAR ASSOCIATED DEATH 1, chloroplastic [Ipomoea trifida]